MITGRRFAGSRWHAVRGGRSDFPLRCVGIVTAIATAWLTPPSSAAADEALWKLLRSGGHAALLRHAIAPGIGDPPEFTLADCSTQRNLSATGREQAKRIGERLRANGVGAARVYSSQWCRCLETADLLGLGPVSVLPLLNSFFEHREREEEQTSALMEWLSMQDSDQVAILVTHQVNITALTGVYPDSGELVIIRRTRGGVEVAGSIGTD